MNLIGFQPEHGMTLSSEAAQQMPAGMQHMLGIDVWRRMADERRSFSLCDGESVVACGGVVPCWHGCCRAWAMVSRRIGMPRLLLLTRQAIVFLDDLQKSQEFRRVETVTSTDPQAVKWVRMLGFEKEGDLGCYYSDGSDAIAFSRIRHWPSHLPY